MSDDDPSFIFLAHIQCIVLSTHVPSGHMPYLLHSVHVLSIGGQWDRGGDSKPPPPLLYLVPLPPPFVDSMKYIVSAKQRWVRFGSRRHYCYHPEPSFLPISNSRLTINPTTSARCCQLPPPPLYLCDTTMSQFPHLPTKRLHSVLTMCPSPPFKTPLPLASSMKASGVGRGAFDQQHCHNFKSAL